MKVCGIIAEYNPFHNGHRYQIEQARKLSGCDMVIAVMSGNFVQRGEPAIIDKWKRAKAAIENGVDLVIELPYFYATQSASKFAYGAVELLKIAKVDYISFGSECANLENLQEIADTSLNPDNLRESMQTGMSFPRAYSLLTGSMEPNDILAVSYLKHLKESNIQPVIVQRTSGYLSPEISENASALAIRKALKNNDSLKKRYNVTKSREGWNEARKQVRTSCSLSKSRDRIRKTSNWKSSTFYPKTQSRLPLQ